MNEWIETDGLGGFASGGANTIRSRRYHALLLTATMPPTGRFVLVNGFDAWVETTIGTFAISSQQYAPNVIHPDGYRRIESFTASPWPTWIFTLEDGTKIQQEIVMKKGASMTAIVWRLTAGAEKATLIMRPFFSGRDYHSMHHENDSFEFAPKTSGSQLVWKPYEGIPAIHATTNGTFNQEPLWYRNFYYEQERQRGLDYTEDLAAPGLFRWDLTAGPAICIFSTEAQPGIPAQQMAKELLDAERVRRKTFPTRLDFAADAYIVQRQKGKTIVAGYPWFTDWGRDTFIALRGLCLSREEWKIARDILVEWANTVSQGMLPNRFPDQGAEPEYNSVDASLWYVIAVHDFLSACKDVNPEDRALLDHAVREIIAGYQQGTRYGIRMDRDGLLSAGEPGVQLTWMDAKIGDWVITPRIGKPVEIQALWLNALRIAGLTELYQRGSKAFVEKFWNEQGRYLNDVVDADHEPGKVDNLFRPNQIFAVGGLPFSVIDGDQARAIVDAVELRLLAPLGLRSLSPGSPGYSARYEGGVRERDSIYHQGVIWPWLMGPFVEAWLRVRGDSTEAKTEARTRFLEPLLKHLDDAGLGHVSEIADAEEPYTPRGCPFQAWSVGEAIRITRALEI